MSLATATDVAARLGRDLDTDETARVEGLLEEASELVEGWCNRSFTDPVPSGVRIVTSRMVARVFSGPDSSDLGFTVPPGAESTQVSAGSFQMSHRYGSDSSSGSPWLSKSDRVMLRRWRRGVANVSMW